MQVYDIERGEVIHVDCARDEATDRPTFFSQRSRFMDPQEQQHPARVRTDGNAPQLISQ